MGRKAKKLKEVYLGIYASNKHAQTFKIKCSVSGQLCMITKARLSVLKKKYGDYDKIQPNFISRDAKTLLNNNVPRPTIANMKNIKQEAKKLREQQAERKQIKQNRRQARQKAVHNKIEWNVNPKENRLSKEQLNKILSTTCLRPDICCNDVCSNCTYDELCDLNCKTKTKSKK